jgi:hypothetical protein
VHLLCHTMLLVVGRICERHEMRQKDKWQGTPSIQCHVMSIMLTRSRPAVHECVTYCSQKEPVTKPLPKTSRHPVINRLNNAALSLLGPTNPGKWQVGVVLPYTTYSLALHTRLGSGACQSTDNTPDKP